MIKHKKKTQVINFGSKFFHYDELQISMRKNLYHYELLNFD